MTNTMNAIALLMAWLPEVYFAATDGVQALAWGFVAVCLTILAIYGAIYEDKQKSTSHGND